MAINYTVKKKKKEVYFNIFIICSADYIQTHTPWIINQICKNIVTRGMVMKWKTKGKPFLWKNHYGDKDNLIKNH